MYDYVLTGFSQACTCREHSGQCPQRKNFVLSPNIIIILKINIAKKGFCPYKVIIKPHFTPL